MTDVPRNVPPELGPPSTQKSTLETAPPWVAAAASTTTEDPYGTIEFVTGLTIAIPVAKYSMASEVAAWPSPSVTEHEK